MWLSLHLGFNQNAHLSTASRTLSVKARGKRQHSPLFWLTAERRFTAENNSGEKEPWEDSSATSWENLSSHFKHLACIPSILWFSSTRLKTYTSLGFAKGGGEEVLSIRASNAVVGQPWVGMETCSWEAGEKPKGIPSLPWPNSRYKCISAAFAVWGKNDNNNNKIINEYPQTRKAK